MSYQSFIKLPRLYVDGDFHSGQPLALGEVQLHYLRTVLRRAEGDEVRVFNGRDGEWLGRIAALTRKSGSLLLAECLRPQPPSRPQTILVFSPIRKNRMEWLIEKAVELGATRLQPVQTQNTDIPHINEERIRRQIVEAAEQCERLSVPEFVPLQKLETLLRNWPEAIPLLACIERNPLLPFPGQIVEASQDAGFLVGPEGGLTAAEIGLLTSHPAVKPVSLGENTLRSETAACAALSMRMAAQDKLKKDR